MKKISTYLVAVLIFAGAVAFIIVRYNKKKSDKEDTIYTLLERKGPLAQSYEWNTTQGQARNFLVALRQNSQDEKAYLGLAAIFIQEARITGNYNYYDMAAMSYVNKVLKKDTSNFEALLYKSVIYLSQHHFADGLATAQKAQKINPYNAFVYGILVDGNVEMGNYDSAVANSDRMVSIRPDIRSYSRISYLREIYGDYPGAISAMKMAVDAGPPGDEATEWSRIQLGHLYEKTGDLKNAEMQYTIALEVRPHYAYALAGLARIALSNKNYNKAIEYYLKADSLITDFSIKDELADAYELSGQKNKAEEINKFIIDGLRKDSKNADDDENIGHYSDRELAYAYLKIKDYNKALEHALLEYNRRPDNIDVNETVAWVYYHMGDYANASKYITVALKTKCKNPVLLCKAGLIFNKAGNKPLAKTFLQQGLATNPNIPIQLKDESTKAIQSL
jgi:tetratricopeptide (TPR) repeat protein